MFFSPGIDGPVKFNTNVDGTQNIENLSRFGCSFSIVRVPYAMKLLMQELMVMNIHMKIITDENVDQLMSMSYSSNYKLLLNPSSENPTKIFGYAAITKYDNIISEHVTKPKTIPNIPSADDNVSPGSFKSPIIGEAVPYSSNDFFEAAHDVDRKEEISAEEEQKEKEAKEKELLLSDIIEELPDEVPNDSYTSPRYPEDVSPAYNPNAENESILEFKEEKEEEKGEEKGESESGSTKKIIIASSSEPSSSSSSSSSSEPASSSSSSSSSSSEQSS